jgi:hypothetical protein
MQSHMDSHHIDCPPFAERIAGHASTFESLQRAHQPHRALVQDGRRVAGERHPIWMVVGHYVSLRHLTSRDVSYRFRR